MALGTARPGASSTSIAARWPGSTPPREPFARYRHECVAGQGPAYLIGARARPGPAHASPSPAPTACPRAYATPRSRQHLLCTNDASRTAHRKADQCARRQLSLCGIARGQNPAQLLSLCERHEVRYPQSSRAASCGISRHRLAMAGRCAWRRPRSAGRRCRHASSHPPRLDATPVTSDSQTEPNLPASSSPAHPKPGQIA
jgi:hypothetical protein